MSVVFTLFNGRNRLENWTKTQRFTFRNGNNKSRLEERANSKVINVFNALREDKSLYLALRKNRYSRMAIAMYFGSR